MARKKNKKGSVKAVLVFTLAAAAFFSLAISIYIWVALADLPSLDVLKEYHPPESSIIYDRHGKVVGRFFDEKRTVVPINKLPKYVIWAFLAAEDADFFAHKGIDYFGLLRATLLEIKHRTVGGRRVGGSTITQQTVRTMLLSSRQTYARKLQEIVLTRRIESVLSKEEILHLYLNQIYFGNGAYGIEEASLTYFNKPAHELKLFEAAVLASIPKSPNRINPFADMDRLKTRQEYVLAQMLKLKRISSEEEELAKKAPLPTAATERVSHKEANYFLQEIKKELEPKLGDEQIGRMGLKVYSTLDVQYQDYAQQALKKGLLEIDKNAGYRGPLFRPDKQQNIELEKQLELFKKRVFSDQNNKKVWDLRGISKENLNTESIKLLPLEAEMNIGARVTKVDDKAGYALLDVGSKEIKMPFSKMMFATKLLNNGHVNRAQKISDILKIGDIVLARFSSNQMIASLEQEPLVNGALLALDVKTGGVLAMAGGYDFFTSPFNRATQAKRQPGSGLKPLIYALAMDKGMVTPATILTDTPRAFFDSGKGEFWLPRNSTNKYLGDVTLRRCLERSINICTISLLEKIGFDLFMDFGKSVDLITNITPYPRNLTIALGSAENYPLQVANAFRVLANSGKYSKSHMVENVKFNDGTIKYVHKLEEKQVLKPATAFVTSNILKNVISAQKREKYLNSVQADFSGKTGTTNDARSVWFTGFSPIVLAVVYIGYDDNRSLGIDAWGANTAFPIWADFMNRLPIHQKPLSFVEPAGVEWRYIDQRSGRAVLVDEENPPSAEVVLEAFYAGTAPTIEAASRDKMTLEHIEDSAFAP